MFNAKFACLALLLAATLTAGCGRAPGQTSWTAADIEGSEHRLIPRVPVKAAAGTVKPVRLEPVAVLKDGVFYPNGLDAAPLVEETIAAPAADKSNLTITLALTGSLGRAARLTLKIQRVGATTSDAEFNFTEADLMTTEVQNTFTQLAPGKYKLILTHFDATGAESDENTTTVTLVAGSTGTVSF